MSGKKPAKRSAKKAEGRRPRGHPTHYRPEYASQAAKLCARLGATDADLAHFFDVTEQTINNWKTAHPDFFESLKGAKDSLDAQVEQSLFRRAMGWEHDAVKIITVADGNNNGSHVEQVPYVEHYPGETTAQIFWLKNRQPQRWRDKQELEHSASESLAALIAGVPKA